MDRGIKSGATKTARDLAKQVARQVAREPVEVLKEAGRQVTGSEQPQQSVGVQGQTQTSEVTEEQKQKIEAQSQRLLTALENELADIRKREAQKKAQEAQKEEIEQKQKEETKKPFTPVPSKPGRRLAGFGPKAQAERQQTRVEKPLPPSG